MSTLTKQNEPVESSVKKTSEVEEPKKTNRVYSPNVDIFETANDLIFRLEMPGVNKEDVQINMEKDTLSIEGKFSIESETYCKLKVSEFKEGMYQRKFTIGKAVDSENAKASMKNGILELTLPKIEPKKTKITISV